MSTLTGGAGNETQAAESGATSEEASAGAGSVTTGADVNTGTTATGTTQEAQAVADWKAALEDDVRNDPSMGHINDIAALAKSYVHAQRQMGADKIVVPGKFAEESEWLPVFHKLGLPTDIKDYSVKPPEGEVDADFIKNFTEKSYGLNLLPKQAQGLMDWYQEQVNGMVDKAETEAKASNDREFGELKNEWGPAFDQKVQLAQSAVRQFGDESLTSYLDESGLGDNPRIIKLFSKIGEAMSEGNFEGVDVNHGGPNYTTPAEAQKQFNAMLSDTEGPYLNKLHPNHAKAVEEATKLMKIVNAAATA